MAAGSVPSEIIERERKRLLEILQKDSDSVLDTLTSRRLISEEEYETLENITDPLKKSRKLLILVQKKGEVSCQHFLKCLLSTFPESATIWGLQHEFLKHENIECTQSISASKNSENTFSSREKQPESPEITVSFTEKEHHDMGTSESFRDKKTSHKGTAWASRENEKEDNTPKVTSPEYENTEYEIPATIAYLQDGQNTEYEISSKPEYEIPTTIAYLQDGQRYEEPDDSLYLGKEEYLESAEYFEDAEPTVEEEDYNDSEHSVYDGEEDTAYSETAHFSDEEQSYEDSETGMLLEEEGEEAEEEEKRIEERKKVFKDVLSCLNMDRSRKLLPDVVKQFSLDRGCMWTPETPGDLAWNFLMKVQALDVTARDAILRHKFPGEDGKEELLAGIENLEVRDIQTINPLDVLCASMLCSDSSLQREVMSNMYQCQFALPLLLPDAENNKSILMLGAMKDIVKKWSTQSSGGPTGDTEKFLKTPVLSFVRLGHCNFSKSRILNRLLDPAQLKSHKIFFHQDFTVPVLPRQISDGLVEIMWHFPDSNGPKKDLSFFQKPVALANLRGDLESFWTQFGFLVEVSSAVFFFTDYLGEKEWDLLMFLGEAATERFYFVLSPQAQESEEVQLFQRVLNLKPSQLLFWEGEEAGERGKNMEHLQTALQEVTSSSLRCVSMEDMGSLARELGIQVDQDFENVQVIHSCPSENLARTARDERQQRHSQPESSPEAPTEMPVREPGASWNPQNFHHTPVFLPHLENSCPLPTRIGGNFNHVPLKAPWVMGFHFGSEQRSKWFRPWPFQKMRDRGRGEGFRFQYFQPQRFYSPERFMKFSRTAWRHHMNTFGRPLRPMFQHVQAWPKRPQTMGALERSGAVVSHVGHFHSLGVQLVGTVGKPQLKHAYVQRTQPTRATGKLMKTISPNEGLYPQASQPAGVIQKPLRSASQQGAKLKTQDGPSNPAFQMGSYPKSNSKCLPSSQFPSNQPKPSQVKQSQSMPSQPKPTQAKPTQYRPSQAKPSQPRPTQPHPFQPKPTQTKPTQPQPSQAKPSQPRPTQPKPSQPKPTQPQPSQAKPPQPRPTQPKPCPPKPSQSKPSQPRPTQPKSCRTSPSQAKTYNPRAGKR
ncbi:caspase recruitment domain-containing protein 6 isoform X1 [Canis lupus familiaris]|uniref:Caspase recruitment domain family member 6 n=3 Tax=Canis lupus TaxID=9612 RepID=A0A8C0SKN3_CANLF|nr:caspase recruitment domain-containing protein 6 isoform X1 [Canis lupus dingo]XP_038391162.1 caspase recruitment domain-containing protein 6 isoform X1 [Canis lupus familiaris]XP_038519770.1 caspase recruitment domain-containing protein 6 isoform X1 [Canis lupus familiaris]